MLSAIIQPIANWILDIISSLGYPGIVLTMAIESAFVPLPSEIIMPFSGYLAFTGRFGLIGVALAGGLGSLVSALAIYALGYWGRDRVVRSFIKRYGKYFLLSERELDKSERWFRKYGGAVTFFSRLIPGVRSVISLPAGISRMNFKVFTIYTFAGSLVWSYFLALVGFKLGEDWHTIGPWFHQLDLIIFLAAAVGLGIYAAKKISSRRVRNPKSF